METEANNVRWLIPASVLAASLAPDQAEEHRLTALATAARAGDRPARTALMTALSPNLRRMVNSVVQLAWRGDGPWRDGKPWDAEDLRQEAFIIVTELIAAWSGEGAFSPYLFAYFPWRLRNAWRRLRPRTALPEAPVNLALAADDSYLAMEASGLLVSLADALAEPDRTILLWHIRDDLPLSAVARGLELSHPQVRRRWQVIREQLRAELLPAPPVRPASASGPWPEPPPSSPPPPAIRALPPAMLAPFRLRLVSSDDE